MEVGTIKLPVRSIHKLSDLAVRTQKVRGRYSDGGGLYLNVGPSGGKSWVFMWTPPGAKRREMGLGSYPAAGLAAARTLAQGCREAVAQGRDPLQERKAEKGAEKPKTFAEAAEAFIATATPGWRNSKHAAQWTMTLGDAYCSSIREKPVAEVDKEDVLAILAPIWTAKSETASRLRARIERVLNFARTKGWRPAGENPAAWRGNLENTLPKRIKLQRGHHAAMPYKEVGALVTKLRGLQAMAARALEFTILCASRSGETIGAQWSEFDLEKALWTIPANRMKAGQTHIVPLSRQAISLLERLHAAGTGDFVFPGEKPRRPLSGMAMTMLLRRLKSGWTSPFTASAAHSETLPVTRPALRARSRSRRWRTRWAMPRSELIAAHRPWRSAAS